MAMLERDKNIRNTIYKKMNSQANWVVGYFECSHYPNLLRAGTQLMRIFCRRLFLLDLDAVRVRICIVTYPCDLP